MIEVWICENPLYEIICTFMIGQACDCSEIAVFGTFTSFCWGHDTNLLSTKNCGVGVVQDYLMNVAYL